MDIQPHVTTYRDGNGPYVPLATNFPRRQAPTGSLRCLACLSRHRLTRICLGQGVTWMCPTCLRLVDHLASVEGVDRDRAVRRTVRTMRAASAAETMHRAGRR